MKHRTNTAPHAAGIALAAMMGLGLGPSPASAEIASEVQYPSIAVVSFDQVWDQVRTQYFDFERIESDWDAARAQLRPRAEQAASADELRALLNELLAIIGESHFGVLPAEFMNRLDRLPGGRGEDGTEATPSGPGSTGLSVRLIDGRLRVSDVRAQGTAWRAGIRPGWELVSVDGKPFTELLTEWVNAEDAEDAGDARRARLMLEVILHSLLAFPDADEALTLAFLDHSGEAREILLSGAPLGVELVRMGNLPPMPFEYRLERVERDAHCVMWLSFSAWVPELNEVLRQQREQLLQCPGLVIDLRGNLGGVITTMVTLAADLFEQPVTLGSLLRSDGQIDFRVLPRRVAMDGRRLQPFSGPIAILIDSLSASTSEMFAGGMQASGRARLFGETSSGMALPAQMLPLANGDYLMYAFADYRDGSGRRIEGRGVVPDVSVPPSRFDASQVGSHSLARALDWITNQLANPVEQTRRAASASTSHPDAH